MASELGQCREAEGSDRGVNGTLAARLSQARAQLVTAGIQPDEAAVDVDLYARTLLGWLPQDPPRSTRPSPLSGPLGLFFSRVW